MWWEFSIKYEKKILGLISETQLTYDICNGGTSTVHFHGEKGEIFKPSLLIDCRCLFQKHGQSSKVLHAEPRLMPN